MPAPDLEQQGQQAGEAWEALQVAYSAYEEALATGNRTVWKRALAALLVRSEAVVESLRELSRVRGE